MQKKQVGILIGVVLVIVVGVVLLRQGRRETGVGEGGAKPTAAEQQNAYDGLMENVQTNWTNGQTNVTLNLLRGALSDPQYSALQTNVFNEFMERVRMVWLAGETNTVVDLLIGSMADVQDPGLRERLFSVGEQVLYMAGRPEQAEERFWQVLDREVAVAAPSVRYLYGHKMRTGDTNGVFELTEKLLDKELPAPLKEQVLGWHLNVCLDLGRFARVLELVPVAMESFGTASGLNLVGSIAQRLVNDSKLRDAELLLAKLELAAPDDPLVQQRVTTIRYEMLLKRKDWMNIEQRFMGIAESLDDAALSRLFSRTCAVAAESDEESVPERLSEYIILNVKNKEKSLQAACRQWIQSQVRINEPAGIVDRLQILLDKVQVSPDVVAPLFTQNFYEVMKPGDTELLRRMIAVGERLLGTVTQAHLRNDVKVKIVDGCFAAEEYEKSLKYLEEGLPGRDEEWTAMAMCKMRAHVALKNGKTDEAVKHFREFMVYVGKEKNLGEDPTTGIRYTREMTLGFNAKRIGDIYAEAGRSGDATNAYAEAEGLYLEALADLKKGSKAYEFVKVELAKVPGAKPYGEQVEKGGQETKPAVDAVPGEKDGGEPEPGDKPAVDAVPEEKAAVEAEPAPVEKPAGDVEGK